MTTPNAARALAEAERAFERCAGTPYGHSVHVTDETRTIVRRALREMRDGNAALRDLTARLAAAEADAAAARSGGGAAIAAERRRQIEEEGWTAEHDDQHDTGQLIAAAICYALNARGWRTTADMVRLWPWDDRWFKPGDYRRDLVKAGALIAAEIDRLDRLRARAALGEGGGDG